jgi:transcriptional regulator with XRE-family HTH domain
VSIVNCQLQPFLEFIVFQEKYLYLTSYVKSKLIILKSLGELVRDLRDRNGFLLREVAAKIEIDQALLSKIERGERMPTKEQVLRLAKFYNVNADDFLIAFFSDKLVYELANEDVALKAVQAAEKKIVYKIRHGNGK